MDTVFSHVMDATLDRSGQDNLKDFLVRNEKIINRNLEGINTALASLSPTKHGMALLFILYARPAALLFRSLRLANFYVLFILNSCILSLVRLLLACFTPITTFHSATPRARVFLWIVRCASSLPTCYPPLLSCLRPALPPSSPFIKSPPAVGSSQKHLASH